VGKLEGKRPLGRRRNKWEDEIRMDFREIGWGSGVEWVHLAQHIHQWRDLIYSMTNLRVLASRM
jgi:hypothetical protein